MIFDNRNEDGQSSKRTFVEIRSTILFALAHGHTTVNKISTQTGLTWKTVDNHLIYLIGRGYVKEVFASPYVKIYELSERGKESIEPFFEVQQ